MLCSPCAAHEGDDSSLLFCRFPVAKGRLKCRAETYNPIPTLPLLFFSRHFGNNSHSPTNFNALCVGEKRPDWLARGCLRGQSGVELLCVLLEPREKGTQKERGKGNENNNRGELDVVSNTQQTSTKALALSCKNNAVDPRDKQRIY